MFFYCVQYTVYSCVHCFRALATFGRGALLFLCIPLQPSHHCSRFDHFCPSIPLWPLRVPFARVPFCVFLRFCPDFCAQTLATFISNGFKTVFKRVICAAYILAPFAPFRAFVEPYFRQICRFRCSVGGTTP